MIARAIPKKLAEDGRIRIGNREPNAKGQGTHPHKLTEFRLTSANRSLLHFAAERYGGTVQEWIGEAAPRDEYGRPTQYELYTTAKALDVLIPTLSAVSLSFERWSAAGCQQRCTGEVITHCPLQEALEGTPCTCPVDDEERATLAQTGKACARILRLNVLLPDIPGAGVWRLETKGYYATAELLGTLELLQHAGQTHTIIEGVLRLEQRTVKRVGKGEGKGTLQFAVPVLWPKYTPRQLLTGAAQAMLAPASTHAMQPGLAETIAHLYGDPQSQPAGEAGAEDLAQIEAAILAQPGGDIERWMVWAERRFQKARQAFTLDDYQAFLGAVREAAQKRQPRTPTASHEEAPGAPNDPKDDVGVVVDTQPNLSPSEPQSAPSSWRETIQAHWPTFLTLAREDDTLATGALLTRLEYALEDLTTSASEGQRLAEELQQYLATHKEG